MCLFYLIGGIIYVTAVIFLGTYVGIPVAVIGGTVLFIAGIALAFLRAAQVLTGHGPHVRLVGPADVGRLGVTPRQGLESQGPDPAWPSYFLGQAGTDLGTIRTWANMSVSPAWRKMRDIVAGRSVWLWPIWAVGYVLVAAWSAGIYLGLLVISTVGTAVIAIARSSGASTSTAIRGFDKAWQRRFRAIATCPHCYYLTPLPIYLCPRCGAQHAQLQPGRLGVFHRYCRCEQQLPTSILLSARKLDAICPRDKHPMVRGSGVATDVRIPVFGAASAGKTQLIMSGLVTLVERADATRAVPADNSSKTQYERLRADFQAGVTQKTGLALPVAITLRVGSGRRESLVHVFDAAGERFVDRNQNDELAYLDDARTLVFVLDPFSIPAVRGQLGVAYSGVIKSANAAVHDPEDSYNVTVQRLRAHGVVTEQQRLAFVVSKADLLDDLPVATGLTGDSESIQRWLEDMELENFMTAVTRDFREVRFFLVASTNSPAPQRSAAAPFGWLLEHERTSVPVPT